MQIILSIPDDTKILVKKGDEVKIGDKFFSKETSQMVVVDVSLQLNIKKEDVFQHLKKMIGESVEVGDVIAQKKKLVGSKNIQSPTKGVISSIDHEKGEVSIQTATLEGHSTQNAFFTGTILDIDLGKQTVTVDCKNGTSKSFKSITQDFGGELYYFSSESLFYSVQEVEIENKVILIEELKSFIAAKCEALSAAGFIYQKSDVTSQIPSLLVNSQDFNELVKSEKKYILFSQNEKKAVIYEN